MKILWTKKQEDEFLERELREVIRQLAQDLRAAAVAVQAKKPSLDIELPPPPEAIGTVREVHGPDGDFVYRGYL